ncbi:MAG: LamG-like jellyroll fold domain-containing protein [Limisphaerales bacterium]
MKRLPSMPWMLWVALPLLLAWPAAVEAQLRFVTVVPAVANTSVPDEDGDYPAYIEIRSLETGILSGSYLTDNPELPNRWQFPAGYVLTPGQTIRIFASGKDRRPTGPGAQLHTSFTYDCSVPYAGLYNVQSALVHTFFDRIDRCRCDGVSLIKERTVARFLIPEDDIGLDWTLPGFNDKDWHRGLTGIGYDSGASPFQAGLVLYHTFDKGDASTTTVREVSGPVLHTGAVKGALPMVPGRIHEAFDFKADPSSFVQVRHHAELDPGQGAFSVALWFLPLRGEGTAAPVGGSFGETLLSKQAGNGWSIFRNQSGTFLQTASAQGTRTVPLGPTTRGQWHHVVLVVNRSTSQLIGYLNGKRIGVAALANASESIGSTADLLEGIDADGITPFAGRLDDVAIWNRSLDDTQVGQLFAVGLQGKLLLDGTAFPGAGNLYAGLIGTDVLTRMRGINTSCYIRVPFNVPASPSVAVGLRVRVHYDDGFVAYLNGAEVARRNAPVPIDFLSAAPVDRPDTSALAAETLDLSSFIGLLKPGGNLLAFHALNAAVDDDRFLLAPTQICLEILRTPPTGGDCVKETNGTDFWVTFPENYVQEPDTPLQLSLCIAGLPQTQGIIEIPGLNVPGFPRAFTIPPAGSLRIALPRAAELSGPDSVERKGIHILATARVAVYGTTRMDYTTDTFLALPTPCLGVEYMVSSFRNVFDGIPVLNGSQFGIVAVADGTLVTITPRAKVGTHPALVPYVVPLNRGETYQLRQEAGQPADITGTLIRSSKPIAVFGSHRCANVQSVNQFFCDTVVEELLPVASWGSTFFTVPLATRASDTLRVLSSDNDNLVTVVTLSGSQSFVLQRGEHRDLELKEPTRINCRAPSMITQFSNSSDFDHVTNADPFMTMIQPANTWLSQYRFCTPAATEFEDNYLHLIGPSASLLDIATVNGTPLSAWNPAEITRGPLPTGFAYARLKLQPATSYLVIGQTGLGMIAYGFSEFDSYGYPGGMRFEGSAAPTLTCPPDITVNCQTIPGSNACGGIVPDLARRTDAFDDCGGRGQLAITQDPPAGTALPPGTHGIKLAAVDASGMTTVCEVRFVVQTSWASQQFGGATVSNPALQNTVWGAFADPDLDGLLNSMEEALGTDPNRSTPLNSFMEFSTERDAWGLFPVVSVPRLLAEGGPEIELEGTAGLGTEPWESGQDILEELPGRASPVPGGKHERTVFKVRQPLREDSANGYFLRLKLKE